MSTDPLRLAPDLRTRLVLAVAVTAMMLAALASVPRPFLIRESLDHSLETGEGLSSGFLGTYLALLALEASLRLAGTFAIQSVGQDFLHRLRIALARRVFSLGDTWHARNPAGTVVPRITSETEAIGDVLGTPTAQMAYDLAILPLSAILIAVLDARFAAVYAGCVAVFVLGTSALQRHLRDRSSAAAVALAALNGWVEDRLSAIDTVQALGAEPNAISGMRAVQSSYRRARLGEMLSLCWLGALAGGIGSVSAIVVVALAAGWIADGSLTVGTLASVLLLSGHLTPPLARFSAYAGVIQGARVAMTRASSLLGEPNTIASPENGMQPRSAGRLELRDVHFSYDKNEVLRGASMIVEPGSFVALVGDSGSGKTTIARLAQRFHDVTQGHVLIDGADVREWDLVALRRRVVVVLQEPAIFRETLRYNLTLGWENVSEASVREAIASVGLESVVARFPAGLDTVVAPGDFSMGERQLIALARAVALNPAILVLDEATAHVDPRTEALMERAIESACRGRTMIVIAHRLSTILRAPSVALLAGGRIVEHGSRESLSREGTLYSRLFGRRHP